MWARIFRGYRYVCSARAHCRDNCHAWAGGQLCHIAANIFARRLIGTDRTLQRKQTEDFVAINNNFGAHSIPELCWLAYPDCHLFWYNERWYGYAGTGPDQTEGWGWQAVHDPKILHEGLERW